MINSESLHRCRHRSERHFAQDGNLVTRLAQCAIKSESNCAMMSIACSTVAPRGAAIE